MPERGIHGLLYGGIQPGAFMADLTSATISKCLARFDFERIHAMMVATDWKWSIHSGEDGFRVPTVAELRDQAERLLYAAVRESGTVGSGGFEASYKVRHERAAVSLRFVAGQSWQDYEW